MICLISNQKQNNTYIYNITRGSGTHLTPYTFGFRNLKSKYNHEREEYENYTIDDIKYMPIYLAMNNNYEVVMNFYWNNKYTSYLIPNNNKFNEYKTKYKYNRYVVYEFYIYIKEIFRKHDYSIDFFLLQ